MAFECFSFFLELRNKLEDLLNDEKCAFLWSNTVTSENNLLFLLQMAEVVKRTMSEN